MGSNRSVKLFTRVLVIQKIIIIKEREIDIQKYWINYAMPACSAVADSLRPDALQPTRQLCLWKIPSKNTGVGCLLTD